MYGSVRTELPNPDYIHFNSNKNIDKYLQQI